MGLVKLAVKAMTGIDLDEMKEILDGMDDHIIDTFNKYYSGEQSADH
jgi:hypothetical protein